MAHYLARRVFQTLPVAFGVVTIVFLVLRLLPGDPAAYMLGEGATKGAVEALRARLGLNAPMPIQYLNYLRGLVHLDLGRSIASRQPATTLIGNAFPTTLTLGAASLVLGFLIAVPLGALAAYFGTRGATWLDQAITISVLTMDVVPGFWLALALLLIFSLNLGWLPATGPVPFGDPFALARRLALPVAVLTVAQIGVTARITRVSVLEVLGEDYIRTARAMGAREMTILFRHALRCAALPVVTVIGLSFGRLLAGTVIVESIFALPGMGTTLVNAVLGRDYPVVQAVVLIYATIFILVNLATDIAYTRLDPRISI